VIQICYRTAAPSLRDRQLLAVKGERILLLNLEALQGLLAKR